ncbi:MAG TPA: Gfo/Idh/MocA family oxidoreductase [Chthonomonas sp.]|jgi:predicted dehydrogenase|uniref:Gfo/Idh/MocA family protein n=1 Tax=Chthonomonas sp. TaxID=2282153 RepID=UPI002B4B372A|nr:Gfo/Idh/MocA family oxidoreductase [Chthonomonas sp.]HLH80992.1 Gfo/Idh/MocA family oxidoreductase [Chthonomonas sp.]
MDKVRWAILGTGGIARKLANAIRHSRHGELVAVASRTQASADAFGQEFGIPRRYEGYARVLDDADVEAVYISLPNHLHAEWTVRCANAKKHVLCEKPFTVNTAEAEYALDAVRRAKVLFMEAFQYRCHPTMQRICELIREKAIGELKLIHASFQYNLGPKYDNIRLSNPAAGGGIMDVGCYTISFARLVAGVAVGRTCTEPIELKGCAHIGTVSRVDEQATAALKFPEGIVAYLACGTQVHFDATVRLFGSDGSLEVANLWVPPTEGNTIRLLRGGKTEEIRVETNNDPYTIEADLFAQCLREGRLEAPTPAMTYADTLGNMQALDRWRAEVGLVFDVERTS